MLINTIIVYILLSILLFFVQNYIDKKNNNSYIDNIIIANVYIIFMAGILKYYHIIDNSDNIFLIVLFELLFRLFYNNYVLEDNYFKNNKDNIKKYVLILCSCVLTNNLFINKTNIVFPKMENVKIIIWFFIVLYLYHFFKDTMKNSTSKVINKSISKEREKVIIKYVRYSIRYSDIVKTRYDKLIPLIYSIMIYEDNRRTEFMRNIDKLKYKINHNKRKYGIMQVDSYYPIDDNKSIRISIKRLEKIYSRFKDNNFNPEIVLKKYYRSSDVRNIINVYNIITEFNNKNFKV